MRDATLRILALVRYYLPGYKSGGPVRTVANMVEQLGGEFDFRIVTSDRDFLDGTPYNSVELGMWNKVGSAAVFYCPPEAQTMVALQGLISETKHDVLYLNSFFDYRFTVQPLILRKAGRLPRRKVILAPRGEFSTGALAIKWAKKSAFLLAAKSTGLYRKILWQASTEHEAEDIRRVMGRRVAIHVANDVPAQVPMELRPRPTEKVEGMVRVVFLSRISRMKNLDGALKALRFVKTKVEFNIFGPPEDEAYWRECERLIGELPSNVTARYQGIVPHEDVCAVLASHDLLFLPTRGENFGHVIVEAASVGVPVLISDQTPWRELGKLGAGWVRPLNDHAGYAQQIDIVANMDEEAHARIREQANGFAACIARESATLEANRRLFAEGGMQPVWTRAVGRKQPNV